MLPDPAIERVQAFWNSRPCNIRHSAQPLGSKEYFDEVETRKYFVEPHIPQFADFARWRGKKVLEIGCGIGTDTINFARHGARVTAVELSERSLEMAKHRAHIYGLEHCIRFCLGNAEELHRFVPIEPYDLIYSFGVIHHTPRPTRIIEEIRRYARPGTRVKIMLYHRYAWKVLWILFTYGKGRWWLLPDMISRYSEAQDGCPTTYVFSRRQGRELLERQGFCVIDTQVDHIFKYRIAEYVQHRYVEAWPFRWAPSVLFRWLERHFGWHLCVDAVLPERASS